MWIVGVIDSQFKLSSFCLLSQEFFESHKNEGGICFFVELQQRPQIQVIKDLSYPLTIRDKESLGWRIFSLFCVMLFEGFIPVYS